MDDRGGERIEEMSSIEQYIRTYTVVDLKAIAWNVSMALDVVAPERDIRSLAVIKADGYGHGALEIAKKLKGIVTDFGVATMAEAVELRQNGVTEPILILGYTSPKEYALALEYDITMTQDSTEQLRALAEFAQKQGKRAKCHVKINTGMNRLGFEPTPEHAKEIAELSQMPGLYIEGLFSHLACADEMDMTFTKMQKERFDAFVTQLEQEGCHIPVKHLCNSAGVMSRIDCRYDAVRLGIITYGMYPSDDVNKRLFMLRPALSWYAHVIHVRELAEGESVSYGATYVAEKPMKIAVVSVGYADGYPRSLSNKGRVLIRGQYAPIIGRICMDQMMVDVSHIEDVCVEDVVTLVGKDQGAFLSVEELANLAGSFHYEFVCGIGKRVPRRYINAD